MQNHLFLYFLCATVWGSTWFAIKFQIDHASPMQGVLYRFALSALVLVAFCLATRRSLRFPPKVHLLLAGQGLFMFCLNYILTYQAETLANSGMIALTFTAMIYFNMLGIVFIFKRKIKPSVIAGSLLGLLGMIFIFYNDLAFGKTDTQSAIGIAIGLAGAFCASVGNMFALKAQQHNVPVLSGNGLGMTYGFLATFLIILVSGKEILIQAPPPSFWVSLFYLAILGTVIAFAAYIKLVKEIGAEKAAYTSIVSTVIALFISSLYEGLNWTWPMALGVVFCLTGNYLVLSKHKKANSTA